MATLTYTLLPDGSLRIELQGDPALFEKLQAQVEALKHMQRKTRCQRFLDWFFVKETHDEEHVRNEAW